MNDFIKSRRFVNWFGILGIISFLSYLIAVIFSPLDYPGYDWLKQAVSDLSSEDAPSLKLFNRLSSLYGVNGIVCMVVCCIVINKSLHNKFLKWGIYVYTIMNFISLIGYKLFPLTSDTTAKNFQNIMHVYVVTVFVVLLSIISFILLIVGGLKNNGDKFLGISSIICLSFMIIGAFGTMALPKCVFGLFERFSTLSATAYSLILGIWLIKEPVND